jgi:hypothetical protein
VKLLVVVFLAASAVAPTSQPLPPPVNGPKLIPAYEWDKDNTLRAFQFQMLELIRAQNANSLFGHLDPDVRFSFGSGGAGVQAFKRAWYKEPHWEALYWIFFMGGGAFRDNDHFWAPSVYANWPAKFDRHSFCLVMSRATLLHETQDPKSKAIATLSFDIVKPLSERGHVRVADGRTGWVEPRLLWSPVAYRVGLVRKWGTWKIETFVSGE